MIDRLPPDDMDDALDDVNNIHDTFAALLNGMKIDLKTGLAALLSYYINMSLSNGYSSEQIRSIINRSLDATDFLMKKYIDEDLGID